MNKNNLYTLTIEEAQIKSNNGDITSVELTQSVLDRVMSVEHAVNGYISTQPELALQMAQEADKRRASGENTPLLGIPIAIKDSIVTKNVTTTSGSKILENFVPPYDATVVKKLREAGAVFIGKTNTDEFTMGSSTEFSAFGTTHNPWNLDCVPGGSSGGSAAVVSAQEALGALGTDTGGSIRQPASFCGIVGLKPTYGRVSRYGLIAHGSSLDQIGPLTRTVMDSAILLQVIAGHDFLDSTTLNSPVPDYLSKLKARSFDGIKIGVPKEYFIEGNLTSGVDSAIREALKHVESMGATLIDVSLPHTKYAIPT
ncbi:MAG: glutaminyl-tRNA synthase (glutamine-hydrolyzing) subunit A, partial [Anaerolineaceae bacterium 4572_78]